jgi:redox-sensitive bicupin YhaK (pirin superfamily)
MRADPGRHKGARAAGKPYTPGIMSGTLPANGPKAVVAPSASVDVAITARTRDVDGMAVRRLLPSSERRLVGPFIFFDHFGPVHLAPGTGFDVRPHPHVGLATVTFLFEGEIVHRDSLGFTQPIRPGDVNWMCAGRGIVHSERSPGEARLAGPRLHGIQSWVALPLEAEESEPSFQHHPARTLPRLDNVATGAVIDVIAGNAYGAWSPVAVPSPTLYAHAQLAPGARLPVDDSHPERAVYVVEGWVACEGRPIEVGTLVVLRPGVEVELFAPGPARVLLVGGAKLAGERIVEWNFVSSSPARIEQAKADWRGGRFPKVPGDDHEFIPLPER